MGVKCFAKSHRRNGSTNIHVVIGMSVECSHVHVKMQKRLRVNES